MDRIVNTRYGFAAALVGDRTEGYKARRVENGTKVQNVRPDPSDRDLVIGDVDGTAVTFVRRDLAKA